MNRCNGLPMLALQAFAALLAWAFAALRFCVSAIPNFFPGAYAGITFEVLTEALGTRQFDLASPASAGVLDAITKCVLTTISLYRLFTLASRRSIRFVNLKDNDFKSVAIYLLFNVVLHFGHKMLNIYIIHFLNVDFK